MTMAGTSIEISPASMAWYRTVPPFCPEIVHRYIAKKLICK